MTSESEGRFAAYVEALSPAVGHADRTGPLRDYCVGLLMPGERKSVEPMAAVTSPARVSAQHQSLLHFVGQASWSDATVLSKVRDLVLPSMERDEPIAAWIIDDTGFPKKGKHSVGVTRQYCGQLGKQDNCQVAVSLSIAHHSASLPIAYQLYLPDDWAKDPVRRAKAGVPADVVFATKPQIALRQIEATLAAGVPRGVVLMDAGYGADTDLRDAITALGLSYSAGILPNTTVWPHGQGPLPPKAWSGRGRRPTRLRRDAEHQPVDVKSLALELPADTWQTVTWREGCAVDMMSRFARVRVRPAHRDTQRDEPRPEEWLLIEWSDDAPEPIKYWLSTLPEDVSLIEMVDTTKLRWRIERDYQDLKQEVGLGHYEGRGWRGFHHHATLCIAAYGFLVSERETIPPSGPDTAQGLGQAPVRPHHRPRGAPDPTRTPCLQLHRDVAQTSHGRPRQEPPSVSMLPRPSHNTSHLTTLVTQ